ncbi:sigma 54-interacting transcriptional regulator [Acinetobacter baumannii]|jgi:PAS domain S-box-containing protein|uniref:Sigma 54-interacting transcriptional regulator n=1 Tax=Acinetobacter junii TaxID=40215 RepID=A0AAW5RFU8_ACIJU|nr:MULTISPECIES: sigma 54-interacting transcriptional regulator [Acinetobacter]AYX85289.1 PAS domain S-box protein [Acinetobacter baumannii]MCB5210302.1 sigma 54-interacting transcriptional regulator [Acinetobacter baumannii]MCG5776530.1 sigma 54-interacting transcriptional regulator [Acinetobacter baumannii]MCG5784342.1 sigma 54-interacting transcriptional regulator [Acinetobacter baumannii]MCU4397818.1 sigma 54-interacting transcriptional regulator [Acinetobacter junii]
MAADFISGWAQSEDSLRPLAFEHSAQALMVIDPKENRFIDFNIAAAHLLRYERHDLLNKSVTSIFGHFTQLPYLIAFTEETLNKGQAWNNEIYAFDRNGEKIQLDMHSIHLPYQQHDYMIWSLEDVKDLELRQFNKNADKAIRAGLLEWQALQELFIDSDTGKHLLLSAVGDGIYSINHQGLCTFINPVGAKMLGLKPEDVIGKNIHQIHHHTHEDGRHYPVEECPIYAAVHDGVVHEGIQEVFWRVDGSYFPVEFTSTPVIRDGEIIGAVVVFRDISERLNTEAKLTQALNELQNLKSRLEQQNEYLQEEILQDNQYHEIVGNSSSIREIIEKIKVVAQTDANVMIYGESGTGKELIARAIHQSSHRKQQPLIRVNCAAIPAELFESEFFGHAKGAFTGAVRDRAGRFELADQGTLFLDEIGEIPLELQSKLLRVLQEGTFERVGEEKTRKVNVRIIAATNRNLKLEVRQKRFREDLYFRLNVFPIFSPALRERKEDIPLLVSHFSKLISEKRKVPYLSFSQKHIQELQCYNWPGNIRELQNVLERAMITARHGAVSFQYLLEQDGQPVAHQEKQPNTPLQQNLTEILTIEDLKQLEIDNLKRAVEHCEGKIFGDDGAAKLIGINPTTLISRLKKFGISY